MLIRTFIISAYRIPTAAMMPNLLPGDFIFANKLAYGFFGKSSPRPGDVILFDCPKDISVRCIKRVIALPGDTVQLRKGELIVNGVAAEYEELKSQNFANILGREQFLFSNEKIMSLNRDILVRKRMDPAEDFGPEIVPEGKVFVLGDNRVKSEDSRSWGGVALESIRGKVYLIWLSLDWDKAWAEGKLPSIRTDRFFVRVR